MAVARAAEHHVDGWSRASAAEDLAVLLMVNDREAAVKRLDEALAGYRAAGAERDAARVRRRLRGLGVRRRHWRNADRPKSGWASLTDTERNVAALVVRGLTNKQMAAQMFLSPHTIGFHLRQIFRKLDIHSRTQIAGFDPSSGSRR
jgi:DNA-binding CsgD family transcriptional regulator